MVNNDTLMNCILDLLIQSKGTIMLVIKIIFILCIFIIITYNNYFWWSTFYLLSWVVTGILTNEATIFWLICTFLKTVTELKRASKKHQSMSCQNMLELYYYTCISLDEEMILITHIVNNFLCFPKSTFGKNCLPSKI